MSVFWELVGYALLAVFAENLVLTGGIGSSRMLRAARKPKELLPYSISLCFFTLGTSLLTSFLEPTLNQWDKEQLFRPLVYTTCAALLYVLAAAGMKACLPKVFEKYKTMLPTTSINCIVVAMPFLVSSRQLDFGHIVALCLGSGVGFALAAWLTAEGIKRLGNAGMARAFLGLPALFIYLGILSLAFLGFYQG